jgi:hypothetical protein
MAALQPPLAGEDLLYFVTFHTSGSGEMEQRLFAQEKSFS